MKKSETFKKIFTWPFEDPLLMKPALTEKLDAVSDLSKQCAADKTVLGSRIVPPQRWFPYLLKEI